MATCQFHPQSEAEAYCATCRARLCRRCAPPGKPCALCGRSTLDSPPRERGTAGAPRYPSTDVQRASKEAPRARRRRRNPPPALSYTGGLNPRKGWRRQITRKVLGALLLAGVGGILAVQFGVFRDFARQAAETRKQLQGMAEREGPGGASLASMLERFEAGQITEAEVEATERLMARIQAGEPVDTGRRDALARLSKLMRTPAPATDPETQRLWALLSQWSNEAESDSKAPAAVRTAPERRNAQPPSAKPVPWKVSLLEPASGAQVKGLVTVRAQIEGQGYIERVEFLVNGEWEGLSNRPPFTFDWNTAGGGNGPKTLEVVAYEPSGARHASRRVRVMVAN